MEETTALTPEVEEAIQRGIQEEVSIELIKEPGDPGFRCKMSGSSAVAVLTGIANIVLYFARKLDVPVVQVLSKVAAILLGPAAREGVENE